MNGYDDRPGSVYRMYDAHGSLLYVGATLNLWARIAAHKCDKPWFTEVRRVELEHFDTRREALRAEAVAVVSENPRFNRTSGGIDGTLRMVCPHCQHVIAHKREHDRSWLYAASPEAAAPDSEAA